MHNLTTQQIIVIGAAIVFGLPIATGIIVAHFHSLGGGIFSGLLVFVVIVAVAQRRLKQSGKDQNNE
jgi:hypothetical protein